MAPPKRPWFRFYVEALTDPKLRRLTPAQRWMWSAVLGASRSSPLPAWLMLTEREALSTNDLADLAGVTVPAMKVGLERMADLGLIVMDDDLGAWHVVKWDARQYASDDSTPRSTKHRSNNGDATAMQRPNDPRCNGDATHQRQRQKTETETEVSRKRHATPPPDVFEVTDDMRAHASVRAPLVRDLEGETAKMLDHFRAKGEKRVDWTATWRNWIANAQTYAMRDAGNGRGTSDPLKVREV